MMKECHWKQRGLKLAVIASKKSTGMVRGYRIDGGLENISGYIGLRNGVLSISQLLEWRIASDESHRKLLMEHECTFIRRPRCYCTQGH